MDEANRLAPLWKFAEVSPPSPEFAKLTPNDEVTFIPLEDVWPTHTAENFQTVAWETRLTGYTPFRRGDLLLPKVTPTVTHGRTMIADITTNLGVASTEVYTVRTRPSTDPRWLAYVLVETEFLALAGASVQGTGGLKRISTQFVESYPLPDATPDVQRAIADYLDRETAEIDGMRADLDEMERLLTERKQTTVTESIAVLEGDPNGRKASLNSVAELNSSNVDKKSRKGEKPVRLVNYTDVYYGDILTADETYMAATASAEQIKRVGVKDGDVIFTKDSETANDIGIPALISKPDPDMVCGYHLTIARPRTSLVYPRYLYWAFMSGQTKRYWEKSANGVTRYSIGSTVTAGLRIPLPPLAEQRSIADEIDRETAEIDSMLSDITKLRNLLAERRAAVISAVVTGQIDIPVSPTHKDEAHA